MSVGRHGEVVTAVKDMMGPAFEKQFHGGLSTGPKTAEGRAAISAANTKHGRYKNWREKRAKEKYYRGEIKRVMREARENAILI